MLLNYARALDAVKAPPAYTFQYAFAHHGARPVASEHQIFREGPRERDEILEFNGEKLTHPEVRIFAQHRDPYAVTALAPRTDAYAFTYGGAMKQGRNVVYVFNVFARGTPNYEVTRMLVDGTTFLPVEIEFRAKAGAVVGTGKVAYAKADRYWMPQSASARAQINGTLETENIAWSHYQFYPSLPTSTFAEPRASAVQPAG